MIRLDGAADLCSSLIVNTTLTYLDLSFNSLGSMGGKLLLLLLVVVLLLLLVVVLLLLLLK